MRVRKFTIVVVQLSHRGNDGFVIISDEAGGVQAEDFDRMFCIGYSMSGAGNGLGWAIISRTFNRHGGVVEIENVPGVGMTTTLTLPGSFARGRL
jgi:sensor histidine kinase regulating citrate/malate metabolism